MQVDQTNLWENVTRNASRDNSEKAIAAYQANMPGDSGVMGVQQERFDKTVGVSKKGTIDMATYPNPAKKQDKGTVAEQIGKQENLSAESRRNEMAVIANTTSTEDVKKMEEEGFSITDSDSRTIVTVTDKIKAVLAKAGVDISQYGDGLSQEQLEEITGNPAVAQQIMQALEWNDLPATEANVEESVEALSQVVSLSGVGENAMAYLLKNELEPTIQNLYMASHSATKDMVEDGTKIDFSTLEPQMEQIIADAHLAVDEQNMDNSKWLVGHDIPLTAENLQYLADLQQLSEQIEQGAMDWNSLLDAIARAIAEGKRPGDASMITAKRQLEESRLAMTSEAGATMEKVGVDMDLKPLEDLVEDLKEQEKQYYRELLDGAGIEPTDENVDRMAQTMDVFDALKSQPAYVLGTIESDDSIETIYESGNRMQQTMEKANASYETLMTSPRADMGDSIKKAFTNVDDILTDLNLETSEGNRRAVRILAYNQTAISKENITEVKALDAQMQRAFRNMNPAVTLEMIRKGENPLDMTMEQLNHVAEQIKQETGNEEQERFSRYLWKLEQNHEISEEERSSYIGIYRLIAQVEKTDGAALGFLMNQGADVTMRNLLTAVRSWKKGAMDYTVSDEFDGVEVKESGVKIDEQIEAGFMQNCLKDVLDTVSPEKLARIGEEKWMSMTPEQLAQALAEMEESTQEQAATESYIREQLTLYQQVVDAPEDVYAYLDRYDIPNSMANVLAVSDMLRKPNQMIERMWKQETFSKDAMDMIADLKEKVLQEFGESLKNPSELADAQATLAEVAENVMSTMIVEDPQIKTMDLRMLRQMSNQFTLCAKQAKEECYVIPIQTGDSVTGVSLKVVRGKKEKGLVDIMFEGGRMGKVAAAFRAQENRLSGMIAVSDEETQKLLEDRLDELEVMLQDSGADKEDADIKVAYVSDLSLSHYQIVGISREMKMKESGELAENADNPIQTRRLYHIAESFIQLVQELAG